MPAVQSSLYQHIDFDRIVTFNEETAGSGKAIVQKSWDQRLTDTPVLESDADEQLLMFVPYVSHTHSPTLSDPLHVSIFS